jgi:DnaK suppressor protein
MAAKKPSAKATKAKQPVVKKAATVKEPAKEAAKKAAPAKKPAAAAVPARPKPAAVALASKPTSAAAPATKTVTVEKPAADKVADKIGEKSADKPAAVKPAAVAAAAKPAKAAAPIEQTAERPVARSAPATPAKPTISARPVISNPITNTHDTDAGSDSEDIDGQELSSTNLLAGPRNVKPYIPRRGEQYMNKEQLEHFRQILNTWKRDLMQEVDRTVLHMKEEAANFPDPNDRATQESEFSLELRTRDRERKLIRKIEEAIKRIEDGSYGYCIETGEEIGIKRLEARPTATLCVEAQERRERREKQYGDRDDRYR